MADQPLGLGIGLTLAELPAACRGRLAGEQPLARVDYLNLGIGPSDSVPAGLADQLADCGWPVVVHAVDINLSTDLAGADLLDHLRRQGDALDARWYEEDLGVWVWQRMSLGLHHLPPLLTTESALRSAANVAACRSVLGRPFHVENPPVHYAEGDLDMWQYLLMVADAADCGIILDSGHLIGYHLNTDTEIALPADWAGWPRVREIHISGFQLVDLAERPVWIDQHPAALPAGQLDWVEQALGLAPADVAVCLEQDGAAPGVVTTSVDRVSELLAARVASRPA